MATRKHITCITLKKGDLVGNKQALYYIASTQTLHTLFAYNTFFLVRSEKCGKEKRLPMFIEIE